MRIAQVAPLIESVPPKHYGGTERIVSYLTEELVRAGHDVTLFASGDSVTNARLIASCERSLRKNERCKDPVAREVLLVDHVIEHVNEFDLIHFHTGYLHFPICRYCQFRRSQLCTGASTCPTWVLSSSGFEMCQLSQYRMLNGSLYQGLTGRRLFTMAYRRSFSRFSRIREITSLS